MLKLGAVLPHTHPLPPLASSISVDTGYPTGRITTEDGEPIAAASQEGAVEVDEELLVTALGHGHALPVPSYTIDLDGPPEHRWDEVCADQQVGIVETRNIMYSFLKTLPTDPVPALLKVAALWEAGGLPDPFRSELVGLARCSGLSFADIALAQMFYSVLAHAGPNWTKSVGQTGLGCTGVIANTAASGDVIHGRNLDFGPPPLAATMRNTTVDVTFTLGGKPHYQYVGFAGLVGFWTGMKAGAFSIEGNERYWGSPTEGIVALASGALPPAMLIRQVLHDAPSFEAAVAQLAAGTPIAAPVYYIVGGISAGQGAVVTRNRTAAVGEVFRMAAAEKWFMVQTNYDHWLPAPAGDDRRDIAIAAMQQVGAQGVTPAAMFSVMSTPASSSSPGVKNNATIFTVIMSAGQGLFDTTVRHVPVV